MGFNKLSLPTIARKDNKQTDLFMIEYYGKFTIL
jgi:hypothetical protein